MDVTNLLQEGDVARLHAVAEIDDRAQRTAVRLSLLRLVLQKKQTIVAGDTQGEDDTHMGSLLFLELLLSDQEGVALLPQMRLEVLDRARVGLALERRLSQQRLRNLPQALT